MKFRFLLSFLCALLTVGVLNAADDQFVNLTPVPKKMTVTSGAFPLPAGMKVSTAGLSADMKAEVIRFVDDLNQATGLGAVAVESGAASVSIATDSGIAPEGYALSVSSQGVSIKAATPAGLFYAFQSIKKVLPANVMAGVKETGLAYSLPYVEIDDEPRFDYRGFMLDVSRHFFTVEEVKRMLDVMSYYKMNFFHWHLSDDQGWRAEISGYPRLTTVGATSPNSRFTDLDSKSQYWINRPYGPYFYTKEEMKDVVAYAKQLHIEVIPEVEFLGHMAAAMAAYPEFSCNPSGSHEVWSDGGISTDVLNLANPAAQQFCKDVLTELMDIFPYPLIHIGGDECPSNGWENNAECQALMKKLGLTNIRGLQSWFNNQMCEFAREKGYDLAMWNESMTASGTDIEVMKQTGATIWCWLSGSDGGVKEVTGHGLRSIFTLYGPYYINRRQHPDDPPGAGSGENTVVSVYNVNPFSTVGADKADLCWGVQGTFWTEHVSDREYLEYAALPRLIAIAEAGWTPNNLKNFESFRQRITADRKLLDYGGYRYATHAMLDNEEQPGNETVLPDPNQWYRLLSRCTDDARQGTCIELLAAGSDKIGTGNAQVDRLWSHLPAAEGDANYDYQWWQFQEDPANPGHYAMVCKAKPSGSVNSLPTAQNNTGRWDYDNAAKHYDFVLDTENHYGQDASGAYYYAIRSTRQDDGMWMNIAAGGQNYSVNCWNNPNDGGSGRFTFMPITGVGSGDLVLYPEFPAMKVGQTYTFTNILPDLAGITIADFGTSSLVSAVCDEWASDAWEVTSVTVNPDNSQTVRLRNAATGRFIGRTGTFAARAGRPVNIADSDGADVVIYRNAQGANDYSLAVDGKLLWPNTANSPMAPSTLRAGNNVSDDVTAIRDMGTPWSIQSVTVYTYVLSDDKGNSLGSRTRSVADNADVKALCPEVTNHTLVSATVEGTTVKAIYHRTAATLSYECRDAMGAIVLRVAETLEAGATASVKAPAIEFYNLESIDPAEGTTLTLDSDRTVTAVYSTDCLNGVRTVGSAVSEIKPGNSYVLYDADPRGGGRNCYRTVNDKMWITGTASAEMTTPNHAWVLEGSDNSFKVRNIGTGLYIPTVFTASASNPIIVSSNAATFQFSWDTSVEGWRIKNSTNDLYWDGNSDGTMSGWAPDKGQPYSIFEYEVLPHFQVEITCACPDENTVLSTSRQFGVAGEPYTLSVPVFEGYVVEAIEGNDGLDRLTGHKGITVKYKKDNSGISSVTAPGNHRHTGIYDLQGRRLDAISRPGVYIVNGVKTLVR
ncbi:MAG: beta-N-acetylhexosaminidase [Muribaculaceae bacterium]|nr:beta-N-acetylhexosaminidase [Muribaculaceae bacterium]